MFTAFHKIYNEKNINTFQQKLKMYTYKNGNIFHQCPTAIKALIYHQAMPHKSDEIKTEICILIL